MSLFNRFGTWKQSLPGRLVPLSLLVGIVAGGGAALFNVLLGWADEGFMVCCRSSHAPSGL